MLYRRYRPQKFKEVISSSHIASAISNALHKGDPAHAFFLYGSRGIGKTTTARLLAKSLNCENPIIDSKAKIPFEPCGECASCKAIEMGKHLDLIEIDAASNRGIDSIRELIDKVKLSPAMGKRKVYIIDEVHMLTNEASNALLKTLEEPPEHAFFILCTTNPEKVLDTIKSRCQQFLLRRPTIEEIQEKITYILKNEGREVSEDLISKIASGAKGAFRDAETLLEQILNKGEGDFAFGSNYEDSINLLLSLSKKDAKESLSIIYKILENEPSSETWAEGFIDFLRKIMLYKVGMKDALGVYVGAYAAKEKELNAIGAEFIKTALYQFSKAMEDFRYVAIPTLPLEMAVINLCQNINPENIQNEPVKPKTSAPASGEPVKSVPLNIPASAVSSKNIVEVEDDLAAIMETSSQARNVVEIVEDIKISAPVAAPVAPAKETKYPKEFPFKKLVVQLKETHHSIYLILGTAMVDHFTDGVLKLKVPYSFHKERLLSTKIRNTLEDSAAALIGAKVILECDLISSDKESTSLTDQNIKLPRKDVPLEKVFEDVFGDDIVG